MCHLYSHSTWSSAWHNKCSINTSSLQACSFMLPNCTLAWVLSLWPLRSQMSALDQGTWEVQCLAPWASVDFLGFYLLPSRSSSPCAIWTHVLSSLSGILKPVLFGCHPQSRNTIPRADLRAVWERVQFKLGMSGLCDPGLWASVSFLENGNDVVVNNNRIMKVKVLTKCWVQWLSAKQYWTVATTIRHRKYGT